MRNIFLILPIAAIAFSCNQNKNPSSELSIVKTKGIAIPEYTPADKQLYDTIVALDKIYWEAYNNGDTNTLINFMTDDHEFYHDQGGVTFSKEENAIAWKMFYSKDPGVVGETVPGTNEIYGISDYGALQLSYQRFHRKNKAEWTAPARSIVLWKKTSRGWLQSRVFSLH